MHTITDLLDLHDAISSPDLHMHADLRLGIMRDSNDIWEITAHYFAERKGGTNHGRLYNDDQLGQLDGPMRWDICKLYELPPKVLTPLGMMTPRQRAKARKQRRAAARKAAKAAAVS